MTDVNILGIGAWSPCFSNWPELQAGLGTSQWSEGVELKPELIPPRERRRAPQTVKMAVEVMAQACEMAGMDPVDPAVVFSSAMGDMQITDAMCSTVADQPELVSPTRFHNSVHNAAIGYWSIATGSCQPSTAVAGHDQSGALGLLEACIQCSEDKTPVLYVCQEGAAPVTLHDMRPCDHPLSLALLLSPTDIGDAPLARLLMKRIDATEIAPGDEDSRGLPLDFSGNPASLLMPVFRALADPAAGLTCVLGLNEHCGLRVEVTAVADEGNGS